jgi:hypothetical protein
MLTLMIEHAKSDKRLLGQAKVRELAKMSLARVGPVVAAYRGGEMPDICHSWDDIVLQDKEDPRAVLAEGIMAAESDEERERVAHDMARLIALGKLGADDAKEIRAALAEARQSAKAKRDQPVEDPERVYLVSPDGALLIKAFERICGEDRRDKVLQLAQELLEEDLAQMPSLDPVGKL